MEHFDVVIVGAGPAGLSAALYSLRGKMKTLLLEVEAPGGKMLKTSEISNWPGKIMVDGSDLAYEMFEQVMALGVDYRYGRVIKIKKSEKDLTIYTDDNKYKTKSLIIATGCNYNKLNIENEEKFMGNGISYCAVCDAKLYQDKKIAVIGGGESAFKESLYLSNFASEVYLIHRRNEFRSSNDIQEKVFSKDNIFLYTPYEVVKINGDKKISGISIKNKETEEVITLDISGIFPFIGSLPATDFVKGLLEVNKIGYIKVNSHMETSVKGIFACGDVIEKPLKQIVTASSDGAIAAVSAIEYILNK